MFVQVTLPPAAIWTTCGEKAKFCMDTLADCGAGGGVAAGACEAVGRAVGATIGDVSGTAVGVTVAAGEGVAVGDEHPARSVATATSASMVNEAVLVYTFASRYYIISGLL